MWLASGGEATAPGPGPRWMPCANTTRPPRQSAGTSDRKSTRLNSSHVSISYAVFCFGHTRHIHPSPTRRSSDLDEILDEQVRTILPCAVAGGGPGVARADDVAGERRRGDRAGPRPALDAVREYDQTTAPVGGHLRSEEHTSELQSRFDLVCRLLLRPHPTYPPFPYTTLFRSRRDPR